MASTLAQQPTVLDSPHPKPAAETPVQRSFRGVLRDLHEEAGEHFTDALFEDLDSTHRSDEELGDLAGVDKAQLSRIRRHQAHPPGKLISWAIENTRIRPPAYVAAVCASADGEFMPRPPPSVEDRHEATLRVLHEMGIGEVVVSKVTALLGRK
jgi:hypothetical protein